MRADIGDAKHIAKAIKVVVEQSSVTVA